MKGFRAAIADFIADPLQQGRAALRYFEDGLLLVDEQGKVADLGDYASLIQQYPDVAISDYRQQLIMPGFIDSHVHYPQTDIIASHGSQLLDWLERYTFPVEQHFDQPEVAADAAGFFIEELLRNGTTTAMVFATIHPQSVNAFFEAASVHNLRMICGKVMMDRNAPDFLSDTAQSSYDDSKALIERWHGQQRFSYAVTPRFAPTSSDAQMRVAQQLVNEYPEVYLQSHVAENLGEVAWVKELFPWSRSYLDVYDHYGLLGDRSVYAHCIHLNADDRQALKQSGTAIAFCPTSNLFLGSGLFDLSASVDHQLHVSLATDVGGGTSFSMLRTLAEAYKVCQLNGYNLSPLQAFYLLTLGGARALYLDHVIGNFDTGKEADFVVLDLNSTPLMERRMQRCESVEEKLFVLMVLGDDRAVAATYALGNCVWQQPQTH